ncbi:MAG TPA: TonB-dependent receptor [Caulobacteraceae bacterium]|nr:TonB-dependent receptor [Caulobacteraceae bacterium]
MRAALPALLVFLLAGGSRAQTASDVGPLVVTATRLPQALAQTPDAQVITAADLAIRQIDFAPDALRLLAGVAVADNGAFGGVTAVRIRGAASDLTLTVIDGVVQNDPSQPAGGYDFGGLDLADVARIEVLEGPQSALWGSDAIGGVVAITSAEENGWRAGAEAGSLSTDREWAMAGARSQTWAVGVDLARFRTAGVSKADGAAESDGMREWTLGGYGRIDLTRLIRLEGRVRYQDDDIDLDGYAPPDFTFGESPEWSTSRSWSSFVRLTHADLLGFRQSLTAGGYSLARADLGGAFPSAYTARRQDLRWLAQRGAADDRFGVALGLERDWTEASLSDGSHRRLGDAAVFAVARARPTKPLSLSASARYDAPDGFAGAATLRGGAVLTLGAGLSLTADIGQGFKTPTISEAACDFCFPPGPSTGLRPEHALGWDVGLQEHAGDGRWDVRASVFRLAVRDEIAFVGGRYANIARTLSRGLEASAQARLSTALRLQASYAYTVATDAVTGAQLPRIPRDAGQVSLLFSQDRWSGALSVRAEGDQADLDASTFAPARRPGFAVADLALAWRANRRLQLTLKITNLADRHYEEVLGYGEPRRVILAGVRMGD